MGLEKNILALMTHLIFFELFPFFLVPVLSNNQFYNFSKLSLNTTSKGLKKRHIFFRIYRVLTINCAVLKYMEQKEANTIQYT